MIVLSRRLNESIVIGDDIIVTVVDIRGDKVRLGIQADRHRAVHRQEILEAIRRAEAPAPAPPPAPPATPDSTVFG